MAYINDEVFDQGLDYADTNGTRVDLCSQEPVTYTEATSTYTLCNKTGVNAGAPEDGGTAGGRVVVVPEITDGDVTATGTATHWALTNGSDTLIATGALLAPRAFTSGNKFKLEPITIAIRDAGDEGSAAYEGPEDAVAGLVKWYSLWAKTSAHIGQNVVRLREDGGDTEQDFATTSTGYVDTAAITTFANGANLFVVTLYDQFGTDHAIIDQVGEQPGFLVDAGDGLPAITFNGSQSLFSDPTSVSGAVNYVSVVKRTGETSAYKEWLNHGGGNGEKQLYFNNAANGMLIQHSNPSTNITVSTGIADNAFHAVQAIFNEASSNLHVDGTDNTGTLTAIAGSEAFEIGGNVAFGLFVGQLRGIGYYNAAPSSGEKAAINTNLTTWGIP